MAAAVQVADIRLAYDGDGRGVIAGRVRSGVRRRGSGSNGQEGGDQELLIIGIFICLFLKQRNLILNASILVENRTTADLKFKDTQIIVAYQFHFEVCVLDCGIQLMLLTTTTRLYIFMHPCNRKGSLSAALYGKSDLYTRYWSNRFHFLVAIGAEHCLYL